jgi:hypothetical protein
MWAVWKEDNMAAKLGIVTGFVFAFAGFVGLFTAAQRREVITAAAAYAAVLVVFVSKP